MYYAHGGASILRSVFTVIVFDVAVHRYIRLSVHTRYEYMIVTTIYVNVTKCSKAYLYEQGDSVRELWLTVVVATNVTARC